MFAWAGDDARIYLAAGDQYIYEAADLLRVVPPAGSRAAEVTEQVMVGFQLPVVVEGAGRVWSVRRGRVRPYCWRRWPVLTRAWGSCLRTSCAPWCSAMRR